MSYQHDNYDNRNRRGGGGGGGHQSFASVAGGRQRYNNQGGGGGGNYDNNEGYGGGGGYQGGGGGQRRNQQRDNYQQQHWDREPLGANEDSEIPNEVRDFLTDLKNAIEDRDTAKLQVLYEAEFRGLSEIFYQTRAWPHPEVVEHIIGDLPEHIFTLLYKELYYRHIYESAREGLTIDQRFQSYGNYWSIFDTILNRDEPLDVGLPNEWVWDIIDEFMYQFTQFSTFRAKADKLQNFELNQLRAEGSHMVWNVNIVTNIWLKLVQKSEIQEQLAVYNAGGDPNARVKTGDFPDHPMYKMLGYYSLISLMRLHCLLGDYHSALKVLENVELGKKHLLQAAGLQACLVTTYYHVGVCYMMMRRYQDAIRIFCDLLLHQQRATTPTTNRGSSGVFAPSTGGRTYQVDALHKTIDKMYNCLAVCLILHPMHIDESISSSLRDKLGERVNKIQKTGDEEEFEKLLNQGLPKFVTPATNYDDIQPNSLKDFQNYQLGILKKEFAAQNMVFTIQSYLKLYTSMPIQKLARFLDMKDDVLLQHLYTYKHKMTNVVHTHGSPLNGVLQCKPELDFYIDKDMIYIADTKVAPRYGDFFVRNIQKFEELTETLKHIKVGGPAKE